MSDGSCKSDMILKYPLIPLDGICDTPTQELTSTLSDLVKAFASKQLDVESLDHASKQVDLIQFEIRERNLLDRHREQIQEHQSHRSQMSKHSKKEKGKNDKKENIPSTEAKYDQGNFDWAGYKEKVKLKRMLSKKKKKKRRLLQLMLRQKESKNPGHFLRI
jgi:hypothetical protein